MTEAIESYAHVQVTMRFFQVALSRRCWLFLMRVTAANDALLSTYLSSHSQPVIWLCKRPAATLRAICFCLHSSCLTLRDTSFDTGRDQRSRNVCGYRAVLRLALDLLG